MSLVIKDPTSIKLQQGPHWSSFEKFRSDGAKSKSLESVKDGKVGTLHTKTGQYRIVEEHDFQKLLGLARDVERLRGGLKLVMQAVRVVRKHPDDNESLELLATSVTLLGDLPELPTRSSFDPLLPEGFDIDPDDEDDLDFDQIKRPFDTHSVAL